VEHVGDDEVVTLGDLVHAREHLDEAGPRHHAVVQVVVGRDLRDGAERGLASLPDQRALVLIGGGADGPRAVGAGRLLDGPRLGLDGRGRAVDLRDEDRGE
jgi:hypothetical protein